MPFLKTEIAKALRHDEFFPIFQPLAELRTGQLAGLRCSRAGTTDARGLSCRPTSFLPSGEAA
jgi:EAL domain-containing protein (putative c-di-GMP-specific phosphodiesterase class I)